MISATCLVPSKIIITLVFFSISILYDIVHKIKVVAMLMLSELIVQNIVYKISRIIKERY